MIEEINLNRKIMVLTSNLGSEIKCKRQKGKIEAKIETFSNLDFVCCNSSLMKLKLHNELLLSADGGSNNAESKLGVVKAKYADCTI